MDAKVSYLQLVRCVIWSDLQCVFTSNYIIVRTIYTNLLFIIWVSFIKQLIPKLGPLLKICKCSFPKFMSSHHLCPQLNGFWNGPESCCSSLRFSSRILLRIHWERLTHSLWARVSRSSIRSSSWNPKEMQMFLPTSLPPYLLLWFCLVCKCICIILPV